MQACPPARIRRARLDELEALITLQQDSLRRLGSADYLPDVLEAALAHMGTMDPRVIADGTYLVAELEGELAGGAGWSTRPPNHARLLPAPVPPLPPACGRAAWVRSLYVRPELARRGLGRALMAAVEGAMAEAGIDTAEILVALSGEMFYRRLGYLNWSSHALQLAPGMEFEVRRMLRGLSAEAVRGATLPLPPPAWRPHDAEPGAAAP